VVEICDVRDCRFRHTTARTQALVSQMNSTSARPRRGAPFLVSHLHKLGSLLSQYLVCVCVFLSSKMGFLGVRILQVVLAVVGMDMNSAALLTADLMHS